MPDYNQVMNRITRCPACASVYRVGDEQLSAAGGWLRCGQCQHVFDSTGFVLNWEPPTSGSSLAAEPAASDKASDVVLPVGDDRIVIDDLLRHEDRSAPVSLSQASDDLSSFEEALSTFRPQLDALPVTPSLSSHQADVVNPEPLAVIGDVPAPAARKGGAVLLAILAVLLGLQLVYIQRHVVGMHWPAFESQMQNLCAMMSCELAPSQPAEGVVIESSSLVRRSDDLVLNWTVRNNTNSTVGMTALELTLLNAPDKPVLRKVFLPSHVGAPALLTPGQVWAGELILHTDAELIFSDYRILNFYP